jgi:glycosyltransferase involved in cell wall biosynthesis
VADRLVLQVLPHPGGGGETYLNTLERMDGFRFERFYLTSAPRQGGTLRTLARAALNVDRLARTRDLIHVHGEVAAAVTLPALARRPSVLTLHGLHLVRRVGGAKRIPAAANLRLAVAAASRTICVSESERAHVLSAVGSRNSGRLVVIHNGVDAEPAPPRAVRDEARRSFELGAETVVGAWLGGLDEHKDPVTAIQAARDAAGGGARFTLLIAGDGPLRAQVSGLAARSGGAVRWLGFQPDVRRVLAAADLFVLTSRREGLSMALLEAMATGLPTIVSDEPSNVEAVGDAGVVVPIGNVARLAAALTDLAADESRRLDLGSQARLRVQLSFSADRMVEETARLFDRVLESRDQ